MPKSKRNKIVHLTQVKKKGKDHKEDLMKQIEQYVSQFSRVYIFDFDNTKSDRIMLLRVRLKEFGRIFAGRNAVVSTSLRTIAKKTGTNYDKLIHQITGHRGLLFTDISVDKLICIIEKEVPEFRQKLLGYAQITPGVRDMDVEKRNSDDDDDPREVDGDDDSKKSAKERNKNENEKEKTKKNKKEKAADNRAYEVEFIKI